VKKNKKMIVIGVLLVAITLLGVGTVAYFRRTVTGSLKGPTGNLTLVVNNADSILNETFSVTLQRSEEEPYIYPDDKGTFNIDVDVTGSTGDVLVTFVVERINLPDNLKFYLDENHTEELYNHGIVVKRSDSMTMTLPVYWFWDGSINDYNDSQFINQIISANIKVSAAIAKPLNSYLLSQPYTLDTDVDFNLDASETNSEGLMMRKGTENDEYPIVYYRGKVANNNVIYNDMCWLIVRTTETGGVKLIYNGEVNNFGGCNNYSGVGDEDSIFVPVENTSSNWNGNYIDTYIYGSEFVYNSLSTSPVYVGYMYNDLNTYYDSSTNVLNGSSYLSHLEDNTIDSTTGRHIQNLKDSNAKIIVDGWYEDNFLRKNEESLLEDTVWCNDRSVISETYSIENMANGTNNYFNFAVYTRLYENYPTVEPSLTCNRNMDKFTVDSGNGNGDLTYPVGMLTADEVKLSGRNTKNYYLSLPSGCFWTISPTQFNVDIYSNFTIIEARMYTSSYNRESASKGDFGIRPAISLNSDAYIVVGAGDGSFERPHLINLTEYIEEEAGEQ